MAPPVRGAWLAGFGAVAIPTAIDALAGRRAEVELVAAIRPAVWAVIARCGERWAAIGAIAALTIEAALRAGGAIAVEVASSCAAGPALASAMAKRSHLALRVLAHWLSFAGTLAVTIPAAIAARTEGAGPSSSSASRLRSPSGARR